MSNCPQCNTPIQQGAAFCDNCGAALSGAAPAPAFPAQAAMPVGAPGGSNCPQCQTPVMPGEAFCGNCGASISAAPAMSAPPMPAPQYTPAASPMPPPGGGMAGGACPQCGAAVAPGSAFCDNCGASLGGASPQPSFPPQGQGSYPPPQTPPPYMPPPQQPGYQQPAMPQQGGYQQPQPGYPAITPRMVIQATNAPLNVPPGKSELIVGRSDDVSGHFPDVDLGPHGGEDGGVSRRHAKLVIQGGQCFLEDLQAVNYTFVNKQKLIPGNRQPLNSGDELRFGRVAVIFYTQ